MFELRKYLKSFFYKASPYTQAGQDLFAYEQFGYNGTYILVLVNHNVVITVIC